MTRQHKMDERGNQLYRSGYCLPSVAESDAPAPSSFAVVLNFASLSDFFARMASRRAAARAFASDMASVCFLKRGGAPNRPSESTRCWVAVVEAKTSLDKRVDRLYAQSHVEVVLKTYTNYRCIWCYHCSLYAPLHLVLPTGPMYSRQWVCRSAETFGNTWMAQGHHMNHLLLLQSLVLPSTKAQEAHPRQFTSTDIARYYTVPHYWKHYL
jgi:hypothetical protein